MKETMVLLLVFLMALPGISWVLNNGARRGWSPLRFQRLRGGIHDADRDGTLGLLHDRLDTHIAVQPSPFEVETFIGIDLITNVSQPLLATQIVNTSTGATITYDYRPNAQRDGVEFTMRVVHDRPGVGGDCTRQIQAIIQLDSTVVNASTTSNGNLGPRPPRRLASRRLRRTGRVLAGVGTGGGPDARDWGGVVVAPVPRWLVAWYCWRRWLDRTLPAAVAAPDTPSMRTQTKATVRRVPAQAEPDGPEAAIRWAMGVVVWSAQLEGRRSERIRETSLTIGRVHDRRALTRGPTSRGHPTKHRRARWGS